MARNKLITIRIEGEKRDAFNQLAKSQNTDTASLLYDFINQCLDGAIDIGIVTGKKQRIDSIDTDRIDKLETTSQRLDERLGIITKKLDDWIEVINDRLSDCDQGLSEKIFSLDHRLKALSMQLDSHRLDNSIDSIDTTSQQIDSIDSIDTTSQQIDTPKTHKAIAERLGLKNATTLNYWIKSGIPEPYQSRIQIVDRGGKKKIEWIS
jgi:hypothetical protein